MDKIFDIVLQNRKILYRILKNTPREQLVTIPEGYRNNIWWNVVHTVVTQQLLAYDRSELPMYVSDDLVARFRKGTVPEGVPSEKEIEKILGLLFSTVELTQADYQKGLFQKYSSYTTSNKVVLNTIEDGLTFNVFHEGLHLGVILSIQKTLLQGN